MCRELAHNPSSAYRIYHGPVIAGNATVEDLNQLWYLKVVERAFE